MTTKRFTIYALACVAMIFSACQKVEPEMDDTTETLVIDGWIESGNHPMVFVTTAVPATEKEQTLSDFADHLIRYANVSIEYEGIVYPLTGCVSEYYFIPTYFTTTDLVGEVDGEYTLRVEYNGLYAESTTYIPEPAELDSLWSYESDEKPYRDIKCSFHDDPDEYNYYRFFTWITNRQNHYEPSLMGLMDDSAAGETITLNVDAGSSLPNIGDYVRYYSGDIVKIKFATMSDEVYRFWSKVDQNNILAFLPFNVAGANVYGNVDGALGCWAGYGITEYTICVK